MPAATLQRIRDAMRQRAMTVPPVDDEWRRHFTSLPEDLQAADLRIFGGSGF
jgi:hypothetical protein